ncbi:MAG TPA: hypothetical protein VGI45_09075 [Terracidiphilus sp.]
MASTKKRVEGSHDELIPLTRDELWEHYFQIATVDLEMTYEEFLDSTPKRLAIMMERKQQFMQRDGRLTGILAATVANFSFVRPENKWFTPSDFIGGLPEAQQEAEQTNSTDNSPDAVRDNFQNAFRQMMQPLKDAKIQL